MTGEGKYNGWTNWETWHTSLLIDNEYDLYQKKVELMKNKASLPQFKSGLRKAETMTRKYWKENSKENPEGWGKSFGTVNWQEIYDSAKEEGY